MRTKVCLPIHGISLLSLLLLAACTLASEQPSQRAPIKEDKMAIKLTTAEFEKVLAGAKHPFSLQELLASAKIVSPWTPQDDAKRLIESNSSLGSTYRLYRVESEEIKDISLKGWLLKLEEPTLFEVTRILLVGYDEAAQVYQWKNGKYQKAEKIEGRKPNQ